MITRVITKNIRIEQNHEKGEKTWENSKSRQKKRNFKEFGTSLYP